MKKSQRATMRQLYHRPYRKKVIRQLFTLSLLLFSQLMTPSAYAQKNRITLKLKNVSVLSAMDSIQQRSGYQFSYNLSLTPFFKKNLVNLHLSDEPIEKALSILFDGKGISYRIADNIVLLSKNETPRQTKQQPLLLQTIKGKVIDRETHAPLSDVSITVMNEPGRGAITDSNGFFSVKVPPGMQNLRCSFAGYLEYITPDIAVISGKETLLSIEMQESGKTMEAVTVNAADRIGRSLNSMASVSSNMLTPEDAGRFAGGYNDPARMVSALPGVISSGDGRNNMIIRGNSPKGVLWKLEGIEIPAPNHFSRGQGDGGGVFSIITANMLSNFDFFTGAFPAEYGNALSGIMDLNLRKGNPDKREYSVEAGMIGTQISMEGPLSKKNKSSYLLHYRYGNLQFLNNLGIIGLDDNQKPPVFQDLSLNINIPTKKAGSFSIFGIGGFSKTGTYRQNNTTGPSMNPDAQKEETEFHQIGILGVKHTLQLPDKKTYLTSVLSLSWQSDRFERHDLDENNKPVLSDSSRYNYPTVRLTTSINHKLNSKNVLRAGFIYSQYFFDVYGKRRILNGGYDNHLDEHGNTGLAEGFVQWKHRLTESLEINTGLHATAFLLNNNYLIEPRFGAQWRTGNNSAFSYGFGLHSRIEPVSLYFVKKSMNDGSITQPNLNLKPSKAMHHVLGYELSPAKDFRLKIEAYYQYLYDVPVIDVAGNTYSVINSVDKIPDSAYVNKGKGYNKGIELTLDKSFSNDYYFLLTGSIFDSKYKPANGVKYNTYFNTGYQANGLVGKDFRTGKKGLNVFSINLRAIVHGGFRYSTAQIPTSGTPVFYFPPEGTYASQAPRFVRFDTGFKFRKNNSRYSWILSLDIQNLANKKNVLNYEYSQGPDNSMWRNPVEDLGIIPILNLKVEF